MQDYVGKQIDRYRITERLGMGGMAVVYKAYDTRLERDVALKLIRTDEIPPSQYERLMKRFEREAKSQARFTHRHIVPVHDYGEVSGSPYLVMAYISGKSMKAKVSQPVDWRRAVKWLIPVAEALSYAHRRGVVHRDVKPSNILFDDEGQPTLTDFGIAKILETDEATLTGTGLGVGTPEYMAPEQWQGRASPATDQYALGVVLYELITGQKPYSADTPAAVAILQAMEPLTAPSRLMEGIPEAVEKVLYKALAKQPEDRYADMAAFQTALKGLLGDAEYPVTKPAAPAKPAPAPPAMVDSEAETVDQLQESPPAPILIEKSPEKEKPKPAKGRKKRTWLLWAGLAAVVLLSASMAFVLGIIPPIFRPSINTLCGVDFSPNGRYLASGTNSAVLLWDAETGNPIRSFEGHSAFVRSVDFSPDGRWLASGSYDSTVRLWNVETGEVIHILEGHTSSVRSVAFSPEGRTIASGSEDGTVRLWDVETGESIRSFKGHEGYVMSVAFSPDGLWLASGGWDNTLRMWNTQTGDLVLTLKGHSRFVESVAFSPDGRTLASGSGDKTVRIWNAETGDLIRTLEGHSYFVRSVVFSPDGSRLASAGADDTVRLWDAQTGKQIFILEGHTECVYSVAFSPDGGTLGSGSWDGTVRLWDAQTGGLIRTISID